MLKRKIRRKNKASKKGGSNGIYMSSFLAMKDADSGEIQFRDVAWKVEEKEMHYMPVYQRAHELMPQPRSMLMDPEEYRDELEPAISLLQKTAAGRPTKSDDILRALGILGHSPNSASIRALSCFSESNHSLAPVASLALSECTGLYGIFS